MKVKEMTKYMPMKNKYITLFSLPLRNKRDDEKHKHVKKDHQTNIVNQLGNHKLSKV